jgi:flagellar biosynthetic protein FliQ
MNIDQSILDAVRVSLMITMKVAAPILAAGALIGLVISLIQAVTQIQEQTLVFVPKIIAMLLVSLALLSWIVQRVGEFAVQMFTLFVGPHA